MKVDYQNPPTPASFQPARTRELDWRGFTAATAMVVLCTLIAYPFARKLHLNDINVLMFYLLGVLWIATRYSRSAATLASFLAVASFDFFFVPPFYTFAVADEQYIFTFLVMLVTALTICTLTLRVRTQAHEAGQRERRTHTLLSLSRDLAAARTSDSILMAAVRHASQVLDCRAVVLLADADGRLSLKADSSGPAPLDAKEMGVAQWAHDHGQLAGAGTSTLPAAAGTYMPMKTSRGAAGVMGLIRQQESSGWEPEQRQLIEAFASQTAVAVERAILAEEARVAWERVEAEFLRNTLLSGVSHELRTPLAAIMGAAGALIKSRESLPPQTQSELLETIHSETERMERLITNLLDMTRLESGGLALKKEWQPLQEVIGSTLHHLDRRLKGREVKIDLPPDLPLVRIDAVAFEQVLANLLDNALEYTPPATPIEIRAHQDQNGTVIEVADHGPGLPSGTEQRVFQKFFRAAQTDARRGIGLGLTISKGIVEAHGGNITAENRPEGGARFRITLPTDGIPPKVNVSA
jgi:two-component system, OmpR family, sensor histidine kinase KdpD